MTYQYQIVIRTLQTSTWIQYYIDSCQVDFQSESSEAIKKIIECYGSTGNPQLFLEQLLALFSSVPSYPGQSEHSSDLSDDQLKPKVQSLVAANESLLLAKQELEEQASTLSRTKENREVEKGTSINCHLAAFKRLEPLRSRCHSQKNLYFSRCPKVEGGKSRAET